MKSFLEPWHLLLLILAGWINHRQQNAIEYLRTENQILKEKLGKRRILHSSRRKKTGRPPVSDEIVELALRMARENPTGVTTASRVLSPTLATRSPTPRIPSARIPGQ
jgi:hypothetical protein